MAKELSLVAYNNLDSQVEALETDGCIIFYELFSENKTAE